MAERQAKPVPRRVLQAISEFITYLDALPDDEPTDYRGPFVSFRGSLRSLSMVLSGDEARRYHALVRLVMDALKDRPSLGRSFAERAVQSAILRGFGYPVDHKSVPAEDGQELEGPHTSEPLATRIANGLEELAQVLAQPPAHWVLYMRVEGAMPPSRALKLGDVEIRPLTKPLLRRLQRETGDGPERTELFAKDWAGQAVARVEGVGYDGGLVADEARARVSRALDVLNFFGDIVGSVSALHLAGMKPSGLDPILYVIKSHGAERPNLFLGGTRHGHDYPYDFRRLGSRVARRHGSRQVLQLLRKKVLTEAEERTLSALQWAGRAAVELRPEEAVLLNLIALESLLIRGDQGELSFRLSAFAAILLARTPAERREVFELAKRAYGKRSKIVHEGLLDIAAEYVGEVRALVRHTFAAALTSRSFPRALKHKDFDTWLRDQLLGGRVVS